MRQDSVKVLAPRTGEDGGCGEILRLEHRQREEYTAPPEILNR
jgi:hypothetical protein